MTKDQEIAQLRSEVAELRERVHLLRGDLEACDLGVVAGLERAIQESAALIATEFGEGAA